MSHTSSTNAEEVVDIWEDLSCLVAQLLALCNTDAPLKAYRPFHETALRMLMRSPTADAYTSLMTIERFCQQCEPHTVCDQIGVAFSAGLPSGLWSSLISAIRHLRNRSDFPSERARNEKNERLRKLDTLLAAFNKPHPCDGGDPEMYQTDELRMTFSTALKVGVLLPHALWPLEQAYVQWAHINHVPDTTLPLRGLHALATSLPTLRSVLIHVFAPRHYIDLQTAMDWIIALRVTHKFLAASDVAKFALTRVRVEHPARHVFAEQLILCLVGAERYSEAIRVIESLLEDDTSPLLTPEKELHFLGFLQEVQNLAQDFPGALKTSRKLKIHFENTGGKTLAELARDDAYVVMVNQFIWSLRKVGLIDEAVEEGRRIAQLVEKQPRAACQLKRLAFSLELAERWDESKETLLRALELNEQMVMARRHNGEDPLRLCSEDVRDEILVSLATCALRKKNALEARDLLQRASEVPHNEHFTAWYNFHCACVAEQLEEWDVGLSHTIPVLHMKQEKSSAAEDFPWLRTAEILQLRVLQYDGQALPGQDRQAVTLAVQNVLIRGAKLLPSIEDWIIETLSTAIRIIAKKTSRKVCVSQTLFAALKNHSEDKAKCGSSYYRELVAEAVAQCLVVE